MVERLLNAEPLVIGKPDSEGRSALNVAVAWSNRRTVQLLLDRGAPCGQADHDAWGEHHSGETLLHFAARECTPSTVVRLITGRTDVNSLDEAGRTALHWAAVTS